MGEILVIALLTILCNGGNFANMEAFGKAKREWLENFFELPNGIPDSDTFRRVLEKLDPAGLLKYMNEWLEYQQEHGNIINIDGKVICGSANANHKAYHVVSAWVSEHQITLGQVKTEEKSNEKKAIPELLDVIDVKGDIVTIDAGGCYKDITSQIVGKEADYVIALKGNQKTLLNDVAAYFEGGSNCETVSDAVDKDHGRIEKREYSLCPNIDWLKQKDEWDGLSAVGCIRSTVKSLSSGKSYSEVRYYITSLTDIQMFKKSVRTHWSIENQLHWRLDVTMREDDARAKKDNSPLNMNVLRKIALYLLKNADMGKRMSISSKMLELAWNHEKLETVLNLKM